jgi:hypothetical protein
VSVEREAFVSVERGAFWEGHAAVTRARPVTHHPTGPAPMHAPPAWSDRGAGAAVTAVTRGGAGWQAVRQQVEALRSELLGVHGAGAGGPGDGGGVPLSLGDFGAAPGTQDELAAEAVSAADRCEPVTPP